MTKPSTTAHARMHQTLQSYEGSAREYDTLVDPQRPAHILKALRQLVEAVPPGGRVLEIGSGPGRDADVLESLGLAVRRTDATQAFIDLMAERGKRAELLNVVTDELGGPYDGVLAMGVLIHVERNQTDAVLRKIHNALGPGGAFLAAMREGEGETTGDYHTVCWTRERFTERLAAAGLSVSWDADSVGRDGNDWITYLARRAP
ncbi:MULTISPECIES: class I SAM-dependent methyltransferase [unclassified Rhizobacter]|uniref:class I SAM-dependent DNA methyltransferase n=1 Tax=unclassified Rhizobacter TaxID=2640088 RepID=UPI0006FA0AE5|nr:MULTISPECIES: class I SAM-dependent methyltransferase [unclassified Rhizobacter]KQU67300.1 methyltransferase type 12 [Rhizobacter sp. Root29]KQW14555.1 methyltransferase type 12 [Rhizobacter sp. Root1238]KRB23910.1 methyltransferase type 12 [Rhizobacter sp. Root16D2]